jgi:uncharacterized protein (TIGR02594 family)
VTPSLHWGPEWMLHALGERGQLEVVGPKHNPRILEYGKAVRLRVTTDEIPWCSNFANWCFLQAGIVGTRSAAAVSWATWGAESRLRLGAVAVWGESDPDAVGTGHVAFVAGWSDQHVLALGGNQRNQVSAVKRSRADLTAVRWPTGFQWP